MVFSSPAFIFVFLPLVLLGSAVGGVRVRNLLLILWSLLFYYYGGGALLVLLLASCLINWALGLAIEKQRRPALLWLAMGFNVGTLVYYKYANFIVAQLSLLRPIAGWEDVALPIGISFFTFQGMSYVLDVWRGEMRAFRNPLDIILCVTFFPHLIAGPIVRLSHLSEQLVHRDRTWDDISIGAARFAWGLAKKVLIADVCSRVANTGFESDLSHMPSSGAWLTLLGYTLQIYFDFSGYSDMAIGLARMFGFRFPENFAHPYTAVSITDFWRRWHLSLSQWFRDYLYIPLGGNRCSTWKVYRNLLIVFLVTGLWHGAAWTFVVWGLYHGAWLMLERATGLATVSRERWMVLRRLATLVIIMISWGIFRAKDMPECMNFMSALTSMQSKWHLPSGLVKLLDVQTMLAFLIGITAFVLPHSLPTGGLFLGEATPRAQAARAGVLLVLLPITLLQVLASDYSPFLYFQF